MDYCTLFPDRVKITIGKLRIDYDIAFFCAIHDEHYTEGDIPRKMADLVLYAMCQRAYPKYNWLWKIVYEAVRKFGWIPWWTHWVKRTINSATSRAT